MAGWLRGARRGMFARSLGLADVEPLWLALTQGTADIASFEAGTGPAVTELASANYGRQQIGWDLDPSGLQASNGSDLLFANLGATNFWGLVVVQDSTSALSSLTGWFWVNSGASAQVVPAGTNIIVPAGTLIVPLSST